MNINKKKCGFEGAFKALSRRKTVKDQRLVHFSSQIMRGAMEDALNKTSKDKGVMEFLLRA